jgi:MraZ protein
LAQPFCAGCRGELGNSIDAQIFPCYPKIARAANRLRSAGAAAASALAGLGVEGFGFVSHYTSRLDAKGRVSIPAAFRAVLAREGTDGLYVHHALALEALDCGGLALQRQIDEFLAGFSPYSEEFQDFSVALKARSEILKIDTEGRVILGEGSKTHAAITTEVTFVGLGFKFQIWEPGRFRVHQAEATSRLRDFTKQLGARSAARDLAPPRRHGARE